ncbi:MAG: hypothetical protein GY765_13210 [bacterium]|nr:hypothetical protein [bacterium]
MKKKNFNKKLFLTKRTIANLNTARMGGIKGGVLINPLPKDIHTDDQAWACLTFTGSDGQIISWECHTFRDCPDSVECLF